MPVPSPRLSDLGRLSSMAQTITQAADGTTQISGGIAEVDRLAC